MEQIIHQAHQPDTVHINVHRRSFLVLRNIILLITVYAMFSYWVYSRFTDTFDDQTVIFERAPDIPTIVEYPRIIMREEVVIIPADRPDESYRIPADSVQLIEADPSVVFGEFDPYLKEHRLTLLGTVNNVSNQAIQYSSIKVDLYDETGLKVYSCDDSVGMINAQGSATFSVLCGCAKNPVPSFTAMQVSLQ